MIQGLPPFPPDAPVVRLHAGEYFCHIRPHVVLTTLGSCISVCLWDQRLLCGGMNHYLLPSGASKSDRSARYGDVAIQALVHGMEQLGSRVGDLQAKVFGGASVLRGSADRTTVGEHNVKIAVAELHRFGIPMVAKQLLGLRGLQIIQFTQSGDVWVRRISPAVPNGTKHNRTPNRSCAACKIAPVGAPGAARTGRDFLQDDDEDWA